MKIFRIALVAAALCWLPMSSALAQTQVKCEDLVTPVARPLLPTIPEAVKNAVKQFYPAETRVDYMEYTSQSMLAPHLKSAIFAGTTAATGKVYVVTKVPQFGPPTTIEYSALPEAVKTYFKNLPKGQGGSYDPARDVSIKPCIKTRAATNCTSPHTYTEYWLKASDNTLNAPCDDTGKFPGIYGPNTGLFLGIFDHTGRKMR